MDREFFIMKNKHGENCGIPPVIINEKSNEYFSYYDNEFGEQWVFIFNRETKMAELLGGDVGWDNVFQVKNGNVAEFILSQNEKEWLGVC